jgi:hypothetical protein
MPTKVFLLRHGPYQIPDEHPEFAEHEQYKPGFQHFAGCPTYGPNKGNIDKARTFNSVAFAKATNEFKHWGYEVVEAEITIVLRENV